MHLTSAPSRLPSANASLLYRFRDRIYRETAREAATARPRLEMMSRKPSILRRLDHTLGGSSIPPAPPGATRLATARQGSRIYAIAALSASPIGGPGRMKLGTTPPPYRTDSDCPWPSSAHRPSRRLPSGLPSHSLAARMQMCRGRHLLSTLLMLSVNDFPGHERHSAKRCASRRLSDAASRMGGTPKVFLYSRLNCDALQ